MMTAACVARMICCDPNFRRVFLVGLGLWLEDHPRVRFIDQPREITLQNYNDIEHAHALVGIAEEVSVSRDIEAALQELLWGEKVRLLRH